jgi:hypothetical protein
MFHLILLHGAKGIAKGTPAYLGDYLNEGIFLKIFSQKISISKILLCQSLCKRFLKNVILKSFETHLQVFFLA